MLERIFSYFSGRVELSAEQRQGDELVQLITQTDVKADVSFDHQNGTVKVKTTLSGAKKIAAALDKSDIIVYINSVCGFKASLFSGIKRIGILFGLCIFFSLLSISTLFVFKVEVYGSEKIAAEEIKKELADFGIRVGARVSDIDRTAVSNRFLQIHPELSWAAISFKGTTVCLEIKEKSEAQREQTEKHGILIAKYDGVVKNVLVHSGKGMVSQGAVVKKGDMLISGYISGNGLQYTDNPQLRFEGASGLVMAQISDSITVNLDRTQERVSTEKTDKKCKVFSFFGIELGKNRISGEYTVLPEKNVTVFGIIELPITYREYSEVRTEKETVTYTDEQLLDKAVQTAYEELNIRLANGELLQMEIKEKAYESGVTVTLFYTAIVDIATPKTEK